MAKEKACARCVHIFYLLIELIHGVDKATERERKICHFDGGWVANISSIDFLRTDQLLYKPTQTPYLALVRPLSRTAQRTAYINCKNILGQHTKTARATQLSVYGQRHETVGTTVNKVHMFTIPGWNIRADYVHINR